MMQDTVVPRVKWGTRISLEMIEALRAASYDTRRDISDVVEELIRNHLQAQYLDEGRVRARRMLASKTPPET